MAHDPQATDETRALRRKLQEALKEAERLRGALKEIASTPPDVSTIHELCSYRRRRATLALQDENNDT